MTGVMLERTKLKKFFVNINNNKINNLVKIFNYSYQVGK